MEKKAAMISGLFNLPQKGDVVESVSVDRLTALVKFTRGPSVICHVSDIDILREGEHRDNALKWINTLLNIPRSGVSEDPLRGLLGREETEFLIRKVIEDPNVADARHLHDLLFRALLPDESIQRYNDYGIPIFNQASDIPVSFLNILRTESFRTSKIANKVASRVASSPKK